MSRFTKLVTQKLLQDKQGAVCIYFFAGRRFFADVGSFSYSCDATRMGRRQCLVGGVALPSKVFMRMLKDARTDVHLAIEIRDSKALETERVLWKRKAREAWSCMSRNDMEPGEKRRRRHRGKALEWLMASDQQLYVCTGLRWDDLALSPHASKRPNPQLWRTSGERLIT